MSQSLTTCIWTTSTRTQHATDSHCKCVVTRLLAYGLLHPYLCHTLFTVQVFLLNRRFQQHQQIIWQGRGGVQDRTIYEDSVFAKVKKPSLTTHLTLFTLDYDLQVLKDSGMMEEREYQTYRSLFSNMSNFM